MFKRFFRRLSRGAHHLCGVYKAADLRPVQDLDALGRGQFESLGADPYFRLGKRLRAGYYAWQLGLDSDSPAVQARIYLDFGQGESELNSVGLNVRPGRLSRRIVHLPKSARVRFDPVSAQGRFTLNRFQLQWIPARLARRYIQRRLSRSHPRYASSPKQPWAETSSQQWLDYCSLFEVVAPGRVAYSDWMTHVEPWSAPTGQALLRSLADWHWRPRFSVLLPVWNPPLAQLQACLDSVLAQTYPHWELCVADDASDDLAVQALLQRYAASDDRIRLVRREVNGHIAHASNSALALARGDFVALLDHDDVLAPQALYVAAEALQQSPDAQLLYSDEDKLDEQGHRCEPFFKPDWCPDLFLSQNYLSHLGIYRRTLVEAVGGFRPGFEGSQDYDLALRCVARIERPQHIVHLPHVLYHWRRSPSSTASGHSAKDYASAAALRALGEHLAKQAPGAQVSALEPGLYRVEWPLPAHPPLVSIVIPTRDAHEILRACVESVLALTRYPNFELVIVDNQSRCPQTLAYLHELSRLSRVRVLRFDQPFNYSAINNMAAREARGEVLCLLNNDVTVISQDWLTEMVRQVLRPGVGCVGAKLYYPDDTLQHAGVVLGIGGVAGHSHKYFDRQARGYYSRLKVVHNVSAVTGAALVVRQSVYQQVGGLDERGLTVAFNDVDFCLKVSQAGYRHVWTPFAELYHHESKTRGSDLSPERAARFASEVRTMQARWGESLQRDPCYSPHLSLLREDYSLRGAAEVPAPSLPMPPTTTDRPRSAPAVVDELVATP